MEPADSLFAAIQAGDAARCRQILAEHPEAAKARHSSGASAVSFAAYHRRPDVVAAISEALTDLDVFEAAILGRRDRVRELLRADAGLSRAYAPDGFPLLGLAAHFGHEGVVEDLLASGADANARSRNALGVQPLHAVLAQRDPKAALAITRRLLDAGADVNSSQQDGFTPLHEAAANAFDEVVRLLLERGADRKARTAGGKSPLDLVPPAATSTAALLHEPAL